MTTPIERALTSEEWALMRARLASRQTGNLNGLAVAMLAGDDLPAAIATANARLADSDLRKLTWAHVDALRESARLLDAESFDEQSANMEQLANIIASYLPPRGTE